MVLRVVGRPPPPRVGDRRPGRAALGPAAVGLAVFPPRPGTVARPVAGYAAVETGPVAVETVVTEMVGLPETGRVPPAVAVPRVGTVVDAVGPLHRKVARPPQEVAVGDTVVAVTPVGRPEGEAGVLPAFQVGGVLRTPRPRGRPVLAKPAPRHYLPRSRFLLTANVLLPDIIPVSWRLFLLATPTTILLGDELLAVLQGLIRPVFQARSVATSVTPRLGLWRSSTIVPLRP